MQKIVNKEENDTTNIEKIKELFPNVVTEGKIDFEKLKLMLGEEVETSNEKYEFTWPGKAEMEKSIYKKSRATLRPKEINGSQNLYIEGDNFEVLKILKENYTGQIKCIYIDPPYNTENDLIYNDNFKQGIEHYKTVTNSDSINNLNISGRLHSNWINMMYPRLTLARDLLADNGVIYISIDDNEVKNLKSICDEIFGETNFCGMISRKQSSGSKNDTNFDKLTVNLDYILVYKKSNFLFKPLKIKNNNKKYNLEDEKGKYKTRALEMQGGDDTLLLRPKMGYSIYYRDSDKQCITVFDYTISDNSVKYSNPDEKLIEAGYRIYRPKMRGSEFGRWRWGAEKFNEEFLANNVHFKKDNVYLKEREKPYVLKNPDMLITDQLNTQGTNDLKALFNEQVFDFPKPVKLIEYLLQISGLKTGDLVLDFFSGSGTTAEALYEYNIEMGTEINYILVQLPEAIDREKSSAAYNFCTRNNLPINVCEIGKKRISLAAAEILEKNDSKSLDKSLFSMDVLSLDDSNIKPFESFESSLDIDAIDQIKEGRTDLDVLYELMFRHGIMFTTPYEELNIENCIIYNVGFGEMFYLTSNITVEAVEKLVEYCVENTIDLSASKVIFRETGISVQNKDSVKMSIEHLLLRQYNIQYIRGI